MPKMIHSSKMLTNDPYFTEVQRELVNLGHTADEAKMLLLRYYRPVRRTWGLEPNPFDFAKEINTLHFAVKRKYDPQNADHIYIGDLKALLATQPRKKKKLFGKRKFSVKSETLNSLQKTNHNRYHPTYGPTHKIKS